jgi:hypothetical protein
MGNPLLAKAYIDVASSPDVGLVLVGVTLRRLFAVAIAEANAIVRRVRES